jgi:ribosomal protein S12 methylthiotransferase
MRGRQVSRPIEELVSEARQLVEGGARELNLIAQDTTSYGRDLYGELRLAELLRALARGVREPVWFRLLYAYPRNLTAEMLAALGADPRFCPYVDLPLQHIADPVLRAMGRGVTRAQTLEQLDLIERKLPGAALRTAFIVGFPGETEAHFEELLAFVREGRFAHAGVFAYSAEPGTRASQLGDRVPRDEKERRREALMLAQREVCRARLKRRVGASCEVLVDALATPDAKAPHGAVCIARSQYEAPEVDGVVYLRGVRARRLRPGARVCARITGALDYDLVGEA